MEQEFNIVLVVDKKDPEKKIKGIKGIDKQGTLETLLARRRDRPKTIFSV